MKLSQITAFLSLAPSTKDLEITALNSLTSANLGELSYCDGEKNAKHIAQSKASALLLTPALAPLAPKECAVLVCENPHLAFARLSKLFAKPFISKEKIAPKIASSATLMPNVYIGSNVQIDDEVIIMPGAFIGDNVSIGAGTLIHPNVVIYNDTKIGRNCHLLANCVIGSDGFGYAHDKDGSHVKIYHNGNVVLEDDVEIGACTTIDRAVFETTLIKAGTKIDNLVQIGHNCVLGDNCLIVAQTGLAGSSELGRNVVMGGQSATSGHLRLGDFTTIAARGAAVKDLNGGVYGGAPAMPQKDWLKLQVKLSRLIKT